MPEESPPEPSEPPGPGSGEAVERTRAVLAGMGAPESLAAPLVSALGPGAAAELAGDPWRLLALRQVTPEQADTCARHALGAAASPDDPRRGRALIGHLLHQAIRYGHTAVGEQHLQSAARSLGVPSPPDAISAALDHGEVMLFETMPEPDDAEPGGGEPPEMPEPERHYALARVGLAEQELGEGITRLSGTSEPIMDPVTAAETLEAAAQRYGIDIAPQTSAALGAVALRGVTVLTQDAGSAPAVAHALAGAAAIAAGSETGIAVAAPTAQAAAVLNAELAGIGPGTGPEVEVVPLAALLECDRPGSFRRGAALPIDAGLVVMAEAMALDVEHAAALVEACADGTHLVLVADPAQAPSASPGTVVRDMIDSGTVAVAELPSTAEPGPLARLATLAAQGELGQVAAPGREVVVVPASSGTEAAHRTVQLLTDSIPRVLRLPAEQVQVVAATAAGDAGTEALNAACKERLNPGPGAHHGFDIGDRVRVRADGPGYAVGDTGHLREAGGTGARVELADGRLVTVTDPAHLGLGWAVSVADAHGGLWPAVVAVFPPETRGSRPQVYTAMTRTRGHLSIVHAAGPDLARAVRDTATIDRRTRLADILREG
ncbi:exodeoxyribonuclease V alpha subunit [Lipingzhangella halophila]|uniref:Exodeoxyribonuclease V alpha subunit n=1 Tax=Lipingzhangella halophila TaxID=1783352 RepID=A0A7W7RIJ0_9ACTN|nr:helix-hairpin-helix domain-containing protein [Lipingzhangella halophila]MBB4932081.1 exodeoxyribonuclease V alpha subunit [Lipingzhangella halophila]